MIETLHLVPQGEGIRFRVSGLFVPAFLVATRLLSRLALFMEFSGACSVLEARTSGFISLYRWTDPRSPQP